MPRKKTTDVAVIDQADTVPVVGPAEVIDHLRQLAEAQTEPVPMLAGTFAAYPTPDGGLALVFETTTDTTGPPGIHRMKLRPRIIRAIMTMAAMAEGDRGVVSSLRGMIGRGRKH